MKLISINLQFFDILNYLIASHSRYKFVVVYVLYEVCIQTVTLILCDPKRSYTLNMLALLIFDN